MLHSQQQRKKSDRYFTLTYNTRFNHPYHKQTDTQPCKEGRGQRNLLPSLFLKRCLGLVWTTQSKCALPILLLRHWCWCEYLQWEMGKEEKGNQSRAQENQKHISTHTHTPIHQFNPFLHSYLLYFSLVMAHLAWPSCLCVVLDSIHQPFIKRGHLSTHTLTCRHANMPTPLRRRHNHPGSKTSRDLSTTTLQLLVHSPLFFF